MTKIFTGWLGAGEIVYKSKEMRNANSRKRYAERKNDPEYIAKKRASGKKWRDANPDKVKEKNDQYRAEHKDVLYERNRIYHKEHREEIQARKTAYREANPEKQRDVWRRCHEKHKEKRNEYSRNYSRSEKGKECHRRYEEAHPEYARQKQHRRRLLVKSAYIESVPFVELCERDQYICQLCGEPVDMDAKHPHPNSATMDHIIPLSQGGTHERNNIQLAHLSCNVRKGAAMPEVH